jgi:N-acetylated-alpha-linked acidic dipeptidase
MTLLTLATSVIAFLLLAGRAGAVTEEPSPAMLGFSAANAAKEFSLEQRFDAQLDSKELRSWLQLMSSAPNDLGSPHNRQNAEFILAQFRRWGWDAKIETFYIWYPQPKLQILEMTSPRAYTAHLHEPPVAGDGTSDSAARTALPPFGAYGADGDVNGALVYVNYGTPADYAQLDRLGINVKGKIVLSRYGSDWRGIKARLAYQHGAIGCVVYSDPQDDGYFRGDVYPTGGWRPAEGVQRGSFLDTSIYPGDPLTPGEGATREAKRLSAGEAVTIAKIPVIPISYADAAPLLAALQGPVVPLGWQGAVPLTYHVGPGPAQVHLAIRSDWKLTPIYDVIARMQGREAPHEWVIRGNHHDGWVFGASDPLAGTVALMEEAKAIGSLVQSGWRPRRTLIYASWDAEEPGWIGSTEWAEYHAEELRHHAALYVNSDVNARGFLVAGGSHSLQHFVNEVASGIRDPQTGTSVQTRLRAKLRVEEFTRNPTADPHSLATATPATGDLPIAALGSGTDFTAFLDHLGIATLDLYYAGEDDGAGTWHSIYDSFDNYVRFGDPDFMYGIAEAETVGHVVLRAANAAVLPLRLADFSDAMDVYLSELHSLADGASHRAVNISALLDARAFSLAADPSRTVAAPKAETEVPHLNFAPLDRATARLHRTAGLYDGAVAQAAAGGFGSGDADLAELNATLSQLEQALTDPRGLPGRPWFKHLIYAPGLNTGYSVKTVPGVREAMEEGRWVEANEYLTITAQALDKYCDLADQAVERLQHPPLPRPPPTSGNRDGA